MIQRLGAILVCAALGFAPTLPVHAQAFRTISVRMGAVQPLRQPLSDGWHEHTGIAASAETPFYAGHVELGAQVYTHTRVGTHVPPLTSGLMYLGWSASASLFGRLRAGAGPRLGIYVMRFDDDRLHPQAEMEQEIVAQLVGRLDAAVGGPWTVRASGAYGVVMLSEPIGQIYLELGLGYLFTTPRRVREVLQ